jgi:hypothetical protein
LLFGLLFFKILEVVDIIVDSGQSFSFAWHHPLAFYRALTCYSALHTCTLAILLAPLPLTHVHVEAKGPICWRPKAINSNSFRIVALADSHSSPQSAPRCTGFRDNGRLRVGPLRFASIRLLAHATVHRIVQLNQNQLHMMSTHLSLRSSKKKTCLTASTFMRC